MGYSPWDCKELDITEQLAHNTRSGIEVLDFDPSDQHV